MLRLSLIPLCLLLGVLVAGSSQMGPSLRIAVTWRQPPLRARPHLVTGVKGVMGPYLVALKQDISEEPSRPQSRFPDGTGCLCCDRITVESSSTSPQLLLPREPSNKLPAHKSPSWHLLHGEPCQWQHPRSIRLLSLCCSPDTHYLSETGGCRGEQLIFLEYLLGSRSCIKLFRLYKFYLTSTLWHRAAF